MAAEQVTSAAPWKIDAGRRAGEMGYLPGLDGIRALAVLGVLLYHADLVWMQGGFLGVDVFFVLSGFLITSLILEEFDRSGRIDFKRFYLGRARRLLPALVLMLAVVATAVAIWYPDAARQLIGDTLASALYVNNWWYILADQSYFEFTGRPPLLKHLWSLAVEEQFYLVWPLVAFLVMRRMGRRGVLAVALVLALLSTVWMTVLSINSGFPELADPSRAYFGTDAHAMGLLIGAGLACAWRPGRLPETIRRGAVITLTTIGVLALLIIIGFFLWVGEFTPWLYQRGGFALLALVVAALIATATHPAVPLGRWLGRQPMRYIGQRSYGLYLWHWPIFMVTRPGLDVPFDGVGLFILRMVLTFGIAELSYRFVEIPIRRGAIGRWIAGWRGAQGADRRRRTRQGVLTVTATLVAVALLGIGLGRAASQAAPVPQDVAEALGVAEGGPTEVSIDDDASGSPAASASGGPSATTEPAAVDNGPISVIGDSVLLGARKTVQQVIPGARVDAAVSRMPGAFVGRVKKLKKRDKLAPIVVLHPGTNGVLPASILRDMLDPLVDTATVIVVNASVPRTWEQRNNQVVNEVIKDYPNVVLADWKSASQDHPEYFVSDGIHLTGKGAKAYAQLIKQAAGL
ncbi:MAG: acyltransferase family protein [Actinomycetales bacterium]